MWSVLTLFTPGVALVHTNPWSSSFRTSVLEGYSKKKRRKTSTILMQSPLPLAVYFLQQLLLRLLSLLWCCFFYISATCVTISTIAPATTTILSSHPGHREAKHRNQNVLLVDCHGERTTFCCKQTQHHFLSRRTSWSDGEYSSAESESDIIWQSSLPVVNRPISIIKFTHSLFPDCS